MNYRFTTPKPKLSTLLTDKRFTVTWEADGTTHVAYRSIEKSAHEFKAKLRESGVVVITIEEHLQ
jgi:hypothetical protein